MSSIKKGHPHPSLFCHGNGFGTTPGFNLGRATANIVSICQSLLKKRERGRLPSSLISGVPALYTFWEDHSSGTQTVWTCFFMPIHSGSEFLKCLTFGLMSTSDDGSRILLVLSDVLSTFAGSEPIPPVSHSVTRPAPLSRLYHGNWANSMP